MKLRSAVCFEDDWFICYGVVTLMVVDRTLFPESDPLPFLFRKEIDE